MAVTDVYQLRGRRLGAYQIVSLISRGGMGVVYRALQPSLQRAVAIKVLPSHLVHESDFRERFQREAETAARLEHPHILPIYDFGQEGNIPYIVMPLITGGTLYDVDPGPLPRRLRAFCQLLSALEYAHGEHVIHRDIKPSNVMMRQGDWPLLADFGLAKLLEPTRRASSGASVVGTPDHMSPEQIEGRAVDARTDLYAMGTLLFQLLTGRLPYEGSSVTALMFQHVHGEIPSACALNPDLPPVWDGVIRRGLAKQPADRYPSATAMDEAVQAAWRETTGDGASAQFVSLGSPDRLFERVAHVVDQGDWRRVAELCSQILELDPSHRSAAFLLAQARERVQRTSTSQPSDETRRLTPLNRQPAPPLPSVPAPDPPALPASRADESLTTAATRGPVDAPPWSDVALPARASPATPAPTPSGDERSRLLLTVLFTDIVGSTERAVELGDRRWRELLQGHHAVVRQELVRYGGREIDTAGDGFLATFGAPADAIAAASAIVAAVRPLGVEIRAGLHTGECEIMGHNIAGIAVHIAARVASQAQASEVVVSNTVRELLAGGEVRFADRGTYALKGVPGEWRLYTVVAEGLALPSVQPPAAPPVPAGPPASGSTPASAASPAPAAPPASVPEAVAPEVVPANNLPPQLTSFIGRERARAHVQQSLDATRLLTLTGAGGCGKTRLALQVAEDLLPGYADGVWLVELEAVNDPALVPQTVASVLDVREEPGRPLVAALTEALQARRLLLVLDNCEHLVSACATLVTNLLRACPHVRVLATSQEALGIAGEMAWPVPSLSLPHEVLAYMVDDVSPAERLLESEAARLFVERAQAAQPTFALTQQNAPAVIQVCTQLDGIPLAIELAAARVKVLTVEQLAARLHDRFRLLTGGKRSDLPRHQTLRAAVDWSYDLLREPERTLLRRLSVFAGGCTLEAAEEVCAGEGIESYEVLDLLTQLVDKSLLVVDTSAGEARYRLLLTIRQYGDEKLRETPEVDALHARLATTYLNLADAAESRLLGPEQATWVNRLEQEHDNLRAALDWAQNDTAGAETGVRLAGALWRFWWVRGHLSEGRGRLERLLANGADAPAAARAKALNGAGNLAYAQGDFERAEILHEQCLALWRELQDERGIAASLNNLAAIAQAHGDYERAAPYHEESLALRRKLGDQRGIAMSLNNLAAIAQTQGDYHRAVPYYEESLTLCRELGDQRGEAMALNNLGTVAQAQGDYARAASLLDASLELFRVLRDTANIAASLDHLGEVAQGRGDIGRALALHEEALALRRDLGDRRGIAISLCNLAAVTYERGDHGRATTLYTESLHLYREVSDKSGIAGSLEGLARVACADGRPERAARLFGAAEALREALGVPLPPAERIPHERQIAAARAEAGADVFDLIWAQGRAAPLDQIVTFAGAHSSLRR